VTVKNDRWIKEMAEKHKMIDPFVEEQVREGVVSYGLSAYGYDFRIAEEFKVPKGSGLDDVLDPKNLRDIVYYGVLGDVIIPPRSYVLGRSVEYFRIPRNVLTICQGKSTYARLGIIINVTPFEPEWEGHATICIVNASAMDVVVYANEGIAQLLFLEGDADPMVSYKDKKGKYQASKGITTAKVEPGDRPARKRRMVKREIIRKQSYEPAPKANEKKKEEE
jgi:dCTP deaminase